jgi:hypothetical protein
LQARHTTSAAAPQATAMNRPAPHVVLQSTHTRFCVVVHACAWYVCRADRPLLHGSVQGLHTGEASKLNERTLFLYHPKGQLMHAGVLYLPASVRATGFT